ncbi:uncharacterized protein K489DRAFT_207864 [Dissoconium aciculare CBS 342.82]|uniref:Uncharacterized protein n=1 Tax=Dissoconium aciculare CBS 342.82 TaxID=1314786 RepID=A0A6J3M6Z9_9PEZI|nr:uncharacterized protein K489DRAFT_207864 [Dissoconium aciculare CBS 342.82]KAF1823790.1 hypothetical protein K489DRAFT_207864 [Dissoconium aciculare CBS 342.82]
MALCDFPAPHLHHPSLHARSTLHAPLVNNRAAYRTVLRPAFSTRANYRGILANALLAASPVLIDKLASKLLNRGMRRICSAESCQDCELCPSPDVARRKHVECSNSVTLIQSLAVRIGRPCESVSAKQSAQSQSAFSLALFRQNRCVQWLFTQVSTQVPPKVGHESDAQPQQYHE